MYNTLVNFLPMGTPMTKDVITLYLREDIFLDGSDMTIYKEMCFTHR